MVALTRVPMPSNAAQEGGNGGRNASPATTGRVGGVVPMPPTDVPRAAAPRASPEGWLAAKHLVRGALDTALGGDCVGVGAVSGPARSVRAEKRRLLEELIAELEEGDD